MIAASSFYRRVRWLGLLLAGLAISTHPLIAPAMEPQMTDVISEADTVSRAFDAAQFRKDTSELDRMLSADMVYTPPPPRAPRVTPTSSPRNTPAPSKRNDRSTPPSSILPSSPATAPQPFYSSGSSEDSGPSRSQVEEVVRKVQIGLMAYGYYDGKLDGMVGPKTRAALTRFQGDFNLNVTGTITPEVLDAFKIVAQ